MQYPYSTQKYTLYTSIYIDIYVIILYSSSGSILRMYKNKIFYYKIRLNPIAILWETIIGSLFRMVN
jgi:hypothetical protein